MKVKYIISIRFLDIIVTTLIKGKNLQTLTQMMRKLELPKLIVNKESIQHTAMQETTVSISILLITKMIF